MLVYFNSHECSIRNFISFLHTFSFRYNQFETKLLPLFKKISNILGLWKLFFFGEISKMSWFLDFVLNFLFLLISFDLDNVFTLVCSRESVAGSVIQATGKVEFEDGLRTGVLPGGCWYPCGSCTWPRINSAPPGGCRLVMGLCGCQKEPLSDRIQILPSSAHGWC